MPIEVKPEDYGAVGDGSTNDWQAFQDMFDDLAGENNVKVILQPTEYYAISSAYDAEKVFSIENISSMQIEGPGMGIKTIAYEGSSTTHFFFLNSSCDSIKFSEAKICGGVGDDWTAFPITNIIFLGDYKRFCTK